MLLLKKPLILPFLCHESASTCQIEANKVANSKLEPELWNCAKGEVIETTAPQQEPLKRSTIFGNPVYAGILHKTADD